MGKVAPLRSATARLKAPAISPFDLAISSGLIVVILAVILASTDQRKAAAIANINAQEVSRFELKDKQTPPAKTEIRPMIILMLKCSLKNIAAIIAVKTISKLSNKDTVDALMACIAIINDNGAHMPPSVIAVSMRTISVLENEFLEPTDLKIRMSELAMPEPI